MINTKLKDICLRARAARDKIELLPGQFLCREVSLAICYAAATEKGLTLCLCHGKFLDLEDEERDHYWVRLGNVIYDATADQFDDKLELVHIISELDGNRYKEDDFVIFNSTVIDILKSMK